MLTQAQLQVWRNANITTQAQPIANDLVTPMQSPNLLEKMLSQLRALNQSRVGRGYVAAERGRGLLKAMQLGCHVQWHHWVTRVTGWVTRVLVSHGQQERITLQL
jgi:hypothetical protein